MILDFFTRLARRSPAFAYVDPVRHVDLTDAGGGWRRRDFLFSSVSR